MSGALLNGRYRIIRELGSGGQGTTFLCQDMGLSGNPYCAVKQLQPANTNDPIFLHKAKRLFSQEIEALGRVGHHPQIPRLLDNFDENHEFYLVQEYVEGVSLSQELPPGKPWQENQVIEMLREVLQILQYIHQQEVIHRDIKPDNIIRRNIDNKLVLIDFGCLKQVGDTQLKTQGGKVLSTMAVGTEGYMAPEQNQGRAFPCSDFYALGMIGIQALTGKNAMELQMQYTNQLTGEVQWQPLAPHVSQNLASILSQMVAYRASDRFQSATELLQVLPLIYSPPQPPQPTPSPTPPPPTPDIVYANFWKRVAAAIIDGIILTIIIAIFSIFGILLGWVYYAVMESSPQQGTLGKMAVGIAVTDLKGNRISFGRATGRYFSMYLTAISLYIGYIIAAFTGKRQTIHDMIAGCIVINKK
ncbi:MAG: RDD family protein [Trichodesmium sp.]